MPAGKKQDPDYLVSLLDWELNVDPGFYAHRFLPPKLVKPVKEMRDEGYEEN